MFLLYSVNKHPTQLQNCGCDGPVVLEGSGSLTTTRLHQTALTEATLTTVDSTKDRASHPVSHPTYHTRYTSPPIRPTMSDHGSQSPAEKPEDTTPAQSEHLNIKVTDNNNEVFFKIKRTTQLKKLMDAFCERQGKSVQSCRFLYDGTRVNPTDNPEIVSHNAPRMYGIGPVLTACAARNGGRRYSRGSSGADWWILLNAQSCRDTPVNFSLHMLLTR